VERLGRGQDARILDAGCGSGSVLDRLADFGKVTGADISPASVAATRARGHDVHQASLDRLPFENDSFDLVTCLDVLEHTSDDVAALRELRRVIRPGGHLLLTVPAYPALWSGHDELNHHHRRYLRGSLRAAAERAGLALERDSHFNALLLPAAAAARLAGRTRRGSGRPKARSDLTLSPRSLDRLLELPLQLEATLLRTGISLPAGLSLMATCVRAPGRSTSKAVRGPPVSPAVKRKTVC
jgi:SAM-dependent methyltransferase